jgi:hypothetical protein
MPQLSGYEHLVGQSRQLSVLPGIGQPQAFPGGLQTLPGLAQAAGHMPIAIVPNVGALQQPQQHDMLLAGRVGSLTGQTWHGSEHLAPLVSSLSSSMQVAGMPSFEQLLYTQAPRAGDAATQLLHTLNMSTHILAAPHARNVDGSDVLPRNLGILAQGGLSGQSLHLGGLGQHQLVHGLDHVQHALHLLQQQQHMQAVAAQQQQILAAQQQQIVAAQQSQIVAQQLSLLNLPSPLAQDVATALHLLQQADHKQ